MCVNVIIFLIFVILLILGYTIMLKITKQIQIYNYLFCFLRIVNLNDINVVYILKTLAILLDHTYKWFQLLYVYA